jgi:apolipoprotein D and lipocalin family protein
MVQLRFIHANYRLDQVKIVLDHYSIDELSFGEITPYLKISTNSIKVEYQNKLIHDYNFPYSVGAFTVALTPANKLVLFKDRESDLSNGQAMLIAYNLTELPLDIEVDNKVVIDDLASLKLKKTKIQLGSLFHTLSVVQNEQYVVKSLPFLPSNRSKNSLFIYNDAGGVKHMMVQERADDVLAKDFSPVDYMGEWHLIAQFPQPYEAAFNCVRQKAIYTLLDDGVKVHNICYSGITGDKIENEVYGKAVIVDKSKPAALRVEFPNSFGYQTEQANYLVHYVKYDVFSLVGSPSRASLYILSRKTKLAKHDIIKLIGLANSLGYDMNKLVFLRDKMM